MGEWMSKKCECPLSRPSRSCYNRGTGSPIPHPIDHEIFSVCRFIDNDCMILSD